MNNILDFTFPKAPSVFVGREKELARLIKGFNGQNVILIDGIAGIGKTSLALSLADMINNDTGFNNGNICWMVCKEEWSLENFFDGNKYDIQYYMDLHNYYRELDEYNRKLALYNKGDKYIFERKDEEIINTRDKIEIKGKEKKEKIWTPSLEDLLAFSEGKTSINNIVMRKA